MHVEHVQQIPEWLKAAPRWLVWQQLEGRKLPLSVRTGSGAGWQQPEAWASFEDAVAAYKPGRHAGLGFVLGDGFVGVDFDGCRHPDGTIAHWAADQLHDLPDSAWLEVSPSGTGLKAFLFSTAPVQHHKVQLPFDAVGGKSAAIECYAQGRWFAVTGEGVARG